MIYLVDKSALARRHHAPVAAALREHLADLAVCDVTVLEVGWSARSVAHFDVMMSDLAEFRQVSASEQAWATARGWQRELVRRGEHRGPGVADLMIAATAVQHRATVLHYDADFDTIEHVAPEFRCRWVVPRGSVA